jgi:hypothetical protein
MVCSGAWFACSPQLVVLAKLLKRREMAWRHTVTGGVHVHARNDELKAFASQKRFEAKKR